MFVVEGRRFRPVVEVSVKKQRPNSARKAAKSARKAKRQQATALHAVAIAVLPIVITAPVAAPPPKKKQPPRGNVRDWEQSASRAEARPKRSRNGPPPRAEKPDDIRVRPKGAGAAKSASKLAPALLARVAAPANEIPTAPARHPAHLRRDEWHAATRLMVPALVAMALLLSLPRFRAPLSETPLAIALRTPQQRPAVAALEPRAPPVPVSVSALRLSRPTEPIASPDPQSARLLETVTVALAQDIARWTPVPAPPAGAPTLSLPGRVPELAAAAAALLDTPAERPAIAEIAPPLQLPSHLPAHLCSATPGLFEVRGGWRPLHPLHAELGLSDDPLRFGRALADAAKAQTHDLVIYNATYVTIAYPLGDVPALFGVCTDVVIRAYRALDIDLQELVHDTRAGPSDASIDHRRTELLRHFFATQGEQLPVTPFIEDYLPGDIVTYYRPQNRSSTAHIAVVTDELAPSGRPMIAHNRGWGVQLEDALFVDQMTGHYRFRGPTPALVAVANARRNIALARSTAIPGPAAVTPNIASAPREGLASKPVRTALTRLTGLTTAKTLRPPLGQGVTPKTALPSSP